MYPVQNCLLLRVCPKWNCKTEPTKVINFTLTSSSLLCNRVKSNLTTCLACLKGATCLQGTRDRIVFYLHQARDSERRYSVAGSGREETLRCLQAGSGGGGGGEGAFLEARSAALALNSPPQQPVKLTPSWEESNLPNEELNFRGVTMETADLEMNPPKDRSDNRFNFKGFFYL